MRIEPADSDTRIGDPETLAGKVSEIDWIEDAADGQEVSHSHQRDMPGSENDLEFGCDEHHGNAFCSGAVGEKLSMSGKSATGHLPGFFADRRGDQCVEIPRFASWFHHGGDGVIDEAKGRVSTLLGGFVHDLPENGKLIVIENDHIVSKIVRSSGSIVGDTPPERVDLGEVGGVTEKFV